MLFVAMAAIVLAAFGAVKGYEWWQKFEIERAIARVESDVLNATKTEAPKAS